MRARIALAATLVASVLGLVACRGDQHTLMAPDATPSFSRITPRGSYTFSLTCSGAGASTSAQVYTIVSSTVSGKLPLMHCGDAIAGVSGFKGYNYTIDLTNQADGLVAICQNTSPIHGTGSITCTDGTSSATLTVTAL